VVQATGGKDLSEVATGLLAPRGLGAFPPQLGIISLSTLIIRIDSPVDVVLTDPVGHRLGAVNGQEVNELGTQGHDTGPQTHPRLYLIQHPQPGNYALRSIGTGSGPFAVHVYSVDSAKRVASHILHTGDASPGALGKHDFTLHAGNNISFSNEGPVAEAGSDQTVDADSSGIATFVLDGSASSDPDGDPLTFTWAGPFGTLYGAEVDAVLPAGVHSLTLMVDDGNGGTAEDTVLVTVNAAGPPPDAPPRISGTVVGRGSDAVGNRYLDVRFSNNGTGHARNLRINKLRFRTLAGSGAVTFLPALSGALPLSIGALDVGASAVVRLFLSVPGTVTRFSITETGTVQNVAGTTYSYSTVQSAIP
jgi:hypothetical protein